MISFLCFCLFFHWNRQKEQSLTQKGNAYFSSFSFCFSIISVLSLTTPTAYTILTLFTLHWFFTNDEEVKGCRSIKRSHSQTLRSIRQNKERSTSCLTCNASHSLASVIVVSGASCLKHSHKQHENQHIFKKNNSPHIDTWDLCQDFLANPWEQRISHLFLKHWFPSLPNKGSSGPCLEMDILGTWSQEHLHEDSFQVRLKMSHTEKFVYCWRCNWNDIFHWRGRNDAPKSVALLEHVFLFLMKEDKRDKHLMMFRFFLSKN